MTYTSGQHCSGCRTEYTQQDALEAAQKCEKQVAPEYKFQPKAPVHYGNATYGYSLCKIDRREVVPGALVGGIATHLPAYWIKGKSEWCISEAELNKGITEGRYRLEPPEPRTAKSTPAEVSFEEGAACMVCPACGSGECGPTPANDQLRCAICGHEEGLTATQEEEPATTS